MSLGSTATSVRGVRGAITVAENTPDAILAATDRLLRDIVAANDIRIEDIGAAFFTTTEDLTAEFPAAAARALGWERVPLLCSREIAVPDGLPLCIRVLLLLNSSREQGAIKHIYLKGAAALRPDLA